MPRQTTFRATLSNRRPTDKVARAALSESVRVRQSEKVRVDEESQRLFSRRVWMRTATDSGTE